MNISQRIEKFRIFYWPGNPAYLPRIFRAPIELDGDFVLVGPEDGMVDLPEELYLREAFTLDLTSGEAMAGFLRTYGVLVPPDTCLLPVGVEAAAEAALAEARCVREMPPGAAQWRVLPLEEIRLHLRVIRDMVRTLDREGRYLRTDRRPPWEWESTWRPIPSVKDDKAEFLERYLNAGLEPFRLRFASKANQQLLGSYLYPALCLQIANHLSEGFDFKTCGLCGGLFVRQQGPNKTDRPWKGRATYCTRKCSQISANTRAYMRKNKEKGIPSQVKTGAPIPAHMVEWFKEYFETHPAQAEQYRRNKKARSSAGGKRQEDRERDRQRE